MRQPGRAMPGGSTAGVCPVLSKQGELLVLSILIAGACHPDAGLPAAAEARLLKHSCLTCCQVPPAAPARLIRTAAFWQQRRAPGSPDVTPPQAGSTTRQRGAWPEQGADF